MEIQVWKNTSKRKYIWTYSAKLDGCDDDIFYCSGGASSCNKEISKNKAIYECIERYSGSHIDKKQLKFSYYECHKDAIDPRNLIFFSSDQYKKGFPYDKFNSKDKIEWVDGVSLMDNKKILVPSFSVYLGYNRYCHPKKYFPTASSGLAVHQTENMAIFHGLLDNRHQRKRTLSMQRLLKNDIQE